MGMLRYILLLFIFVSIGGCEDTDIFLAADAAKDAVTAVTLSDEQVQHLASQAAKASDRNHQVASPEDAYSRRLEGLTSSHIERDGHRFNFKVYITEDVNAFAMADGTIRVYSGLMDRMSDGELLFIIGHEMGHVVGKHSREKVVMAYASSALRKGLASQNSEVGDLARSVLGGFVQQLTNAQFSQHEERQADRYGVKFLLDEGYDSVAARTALLQLAELGKGHNIFLSSHPHPQERAENVLDYPSEDDDEPGLLTTLYLIVKKVLLWGVDLVLSLLGWLLDSVT